MAGLTNEELERQVLLQQLGKKTNHILHFLISFFTGGFWLPVWILVTVSNNLETSRQRSIAETGKVGTGYYVKMLLALIVSLIVFMPILLFWIAVFALIGGK